MVMPRSRSKSIVSRTCSIISLWDNAPVYSSSRSARVDLPWSMWAMMLKFRMKLGSMRYDEAEITVSHMSYKNIVFAHSEDGIAQLTVSRPAKLNALNAETIAELDDAFRAFDIDPSGRALIITGAGEKAFVAGADIN